MGFYSIKYIIGDLDGHCVHKRMTFLSEVHWTLQKINSEK